MTSSVVALEGWPGFLRRWLAPADPGRREIVELFGTVGRDGAEFPIATSRDANGAVLLLRAHRSAPSALLDKDADKRKRIWRQIWTKVATRAGYAMPNVDPLALATLLALPSRSTPRVELIFDTNALIDGAGHWLVRMLGERVDLVRTTVSELEIQRFGDAMNASEGWKAVENRFHFNAASRFLESVPHPHPVWRRLDTAEETALFVAKASDGGGKSPGADALLLRAARRFIQDIVPGMVRFFVTADTTLARSATHELPAGATIAAYARPLPDAEAYISSLTWWPGSDQGGGRVSSLGEFVWECLTVCSSVLLKRADGGQMRVTAYLPGDNQFPSDWSAPRVWVVDEDATGRSGAVPPTAVAAAPAVSPAWPLAERGPAGAPIQTSLEQAKDKILEGIYKVSQSASAGLPIPMDGVPKDLGRILKSIGLVTSEGQPTDAARVLPELFASNDTDALSDVLSRAQPYADLLRALGEEKSLNSEQLAKLLGRSQAPATGLARYLGQAVKDDKLLFYGGACISESDFTDWLDGTIEQLSASSKLKEAAISDIARLALQELQISPMRLRRALAVVLASPSGGIIPSAGGSPHSVLSERVVKLSPEGLAYGELSADGLMGYRTLRRVAK